jgi:hypothetical protein
MSLHENGMNIKKILLLLFATSFTFSSCDILSPSRHIEKEYIVRTDAPSAYAIRIRNPGKETFLSGLSLNGKGFFASDAEVLEEVLSSSRTQTGAFEIMLFDYMKNNKYHFIPASSKEWAHSPALFFNSIGFGFCDDTAVIYCRLASAAGFDARVWELTGHIVPEIKINGRWKMLDPDLGIYYFNPHGEIAGVEELSLHPEYITKPVHPVMVPPRSVYSSMIADYYASSRDNRVTVRNYKPSSTKVFKLTVPPHGQIEFPGVFHQPFITMNGELAPSYANLKVTVPVGWTGIVNNPLVLHALRGTGTVRINEKYFVLGSAELQSYLDDREGHDYIYDFEIIESHSDISVIYLINGMRFKLKGVNVVKIEAPVDNLAVDACELPPENRIYR